MKNSIKILLLIIIQSDVLKCLPIKEDEPHTEILESLPAASLEDQHKPCHELSNNLNSEEQGNTERGMFKIPARMYINNLQYANEYMMTVPQYTKDYLTAYKTNMYQNTYLRLPTLDTLPSVYVTRPRMANYYENRQYYNPELLKQKTVLVPIHLSPERSTSEEEFWAQLSQDSVMKNIIPTMEVPLQRDPYGQYEQLVRSYPMNARELMNNDGVIGYYPESELRAYDHQLLYRYKPKVTSERDISDDYPHTEIHTE